MYHQHLVYPLVEKIVTNAVSIANKLTAVELNNHKERNNEDAKKEVIISFNDLQQARCHWIQLDKLNLQFKAIQLTFGYVMEEFEQMRPLWKFGKNYRKEKLYNDQSFHDHCSSFQAALTIIIESVDEPNGIRKFIRNIGARHFFYDVYEPHTKVIFKSMIMSLCEVAKDDMDEKQLQCWRTLFEKIQTAFNDGLATQRKRYLRKSIVGKEMGILATIWKQVRTKYMEEDGNLTKCSALMYEALQRYCRKIPKTKQYSRKLKEIADQTINAMNKVITAYDSTYGLTELVDRLDSYCYLCCTINVSPRILWMAFNEGFENIITSKLDEDIIQVKQIWWKVARVLEQVIKNFIASNLHIWKRINGIE